MVVAPLFLYILECAEFEELLFLANDVRCFVVIAVDGSRRQHAVFQNQRQSSRPHLFRFDYRAVFFAPLSLRSG